MKGRGLGLAVAVAATLGLQGTAHAASGADGSCATAAATSPASASSTTARSPVWKAFAAFGDLADYFVAPGGDFESGAAGWSLTNARVVRGNENAGIMSGGHSLALGQGLISGKAVAVSPTFCITEEHPTFRFVMKPKGLVGILSTFVRYQAVDGSTREEQVLSSTRATLLPGRWYPSDLQPLATKVPMAKVGGKAKVQLVFRTPINVIGAGYQVDAVLVDPYRTR